MEVVIIVIIYVIIRLCVFVVKQIEGANKIESPDITEPQQHHMLTNAPTVCCEDDIRQSVIKIETQFPHAFKATFPQLIISKLDIATANKILEYDMTLLATLEEKYKQKQAEKDHIEDQYKQLLSIYPNGIKLHKYLYPYTSTKKHIIALSAKSLAWYERAYGRTIIYTTTDNKIATSSVIANISKEIQTHKYIKNKGIITCNKELRAIPVNMFYKCLNLNTVVIPNSVVSIRDRAFYGCSSLASITIPDCVTEIGEEAFYGCSSLAKFNGKLASKDGRCLIVNGVLTSFAPAGLTEYSIPSGVTEIGVSAFSGCSSLTSVYCKRKTPPTGSSSMFDSNASGRKIYVPLNSVDAYKKADGWNEHADDIVGYDFRNKKVVAKQPKEVKLRVGHTDFNRLRDYIGTVRLDDAETKAASKKIEVKPIKESPYYIFFDTETTGIPDDFKAPASDTDNWPRLVQLAWIVASKSGKILKKESRIIYPDGFIIPRDASKVHGITTAIAKEEGEDLEDVLAEFGEDLADTTVMVGHNLDFDRKILHAEYIRLDDEDTWDNGPERRRCTMKATVSYCKIPNKYGGYKWPKLQELHEELFGYEFDDAHDALADIEATFKCYWELRKLGLID